MHVYKVFQITIITMTDISNYLKARQIAVMLAMIILVLGSIVYFSTNVAERNNEMMYKEIYGKNITSNNLNYAAQDAERIKTALV